MAESLKPDGNRHPYGRWENTALWKAIEKGIANLALNLDIVEETDRSYIVGYLCEVIASRQTAVAAQFQSLFLDERSSRADRAETLRILERAGKGNPPIKGDELPAGLQKKARKKLSKA